MELTFSVWADIEHCRTFQEDRPQARCVARFRFWLEAIEYGMRSPVPVLVAGHRLYSVYRDGKRTSLKRLPAG